MPLTVCLSVHISLSVLSCPLPQSLILFLPLYLNFNCAQNILYKDVSALVLYVSRVHTVLVCNLCLSFFSTYTPPTHPVLWSVTSLLHCSSCIVDAFSSNSRTTQAPSVCTRQLPTLLCCLAWQLNVFWLCRTCFRECVSPEPSRMGFCLQQQSSSVFLQHSATEQTFLACTDHSSGACLN